MRPGLVWIRGTCNRRVWVAAVKPVFLVFVKMSPSAVVTSLSTEHNVFTILAGYSASLWSVAANGCIFSLARDRLHPESLSPQLPRCRPVSCSHRAPSESADASQGIMLRRGPAGHRARAPSVAERAPRPPSGAQLRARDTEPRACPSAFLVPLHQRAAPCENT